jgi:predicted permease
VSWLTRIFARHVLYNDLAAEMRAHLEEKTEQFMREGMSREEAEHAAQRAFGNSTLIEEQAREPWQWPRLESIWADLIYGLRQLRKSPGFTITAVLTLALGIGANTAVFSVMNAVLLRFLSVPNPQQLVYLHYSTQPWGTSQSGYGDTSLPLPVYEQLRGEQLRGQRHVFSDLMAFTPLSAQKVAIRVGDQPEEALGEMVSGNFFSGLGVKPYLGRGFTEDDEKNHTAVAVLNYSWWNNRFARDPEILGKTLSVKGVPLTIVGVAQAGFQGADPERAMDFWIPLQNRSELTPWNNSPSEHTLYGSPEWYCLLLLGRLQPGVSWQQALAQLQPAYERAAYAGVTHPDPKEAKPRLYFSSARGIEDVREDYQQPLQLLMGMVVLVLIIACSNVAMLLVARNSARQREFGVRMALGAGRLTLFRQLLTESLLLVGVGAMLGWIFAEYATRALVLWSGILFPVSLDRNVMFFTLAITATSALVFGLAPLKSATGVPVSAAMKTSTATANTDRSRFLGRRLLIALQMSLCLMLLVAAGLLFRTMRNLHASDLGMRADGLLVFGLEPQKDARTDSEAIRFHEAVLDRLGALPGVEGATMMTNRLGSGWSSNTAVTVDGRNPLPHEQFAPVRWNAVGPGYLSVLGIPLVLGRDTSDSDTSASQPAAIVNQTFVERYLPHTNPLGHQISLHGVDSASGEPRQFTIVGVARNSSFRRIREKPWPVAYVPFTQTTGNKQMEYAVRTYGDPGAILPDVRRALGEIDPNLPMERPTTQRAQFEESISTERLVANLSLFFGLLAALLVAIGLYGTLSYRISRRAVEIGVRMALGANQDQILWMVLRESLILGAAGLLFGLPLSFLLARALRSLLYGLGPADFVTFTVAFAGISIVTLVASVIPARRAAGVDPMKALRSE